jgi:hypothetical protein
MPAATLHFIQRVRERIGPDIDGYELADMLVRAVQRSATDVQFVARVDRKGGRLFRFRVPDGRAFCALVDTDSFLCVTVMPPGFTVPREGKPRMTLKEVDL